MSDCRQSDSQFRGSCSSSIAMQRGIHFHFAAILILFAVTDLAVASCITNTQPQEENTFQVHPSENEHGWRRIDSGGIPTKNVNSDVAKKASEQSDFEKVLKSKEPEEIDFDTDIQPIFAKHCINCHGPQKAESLFRVDRRISFIEGGDYGEPLVIPGKPDRSRLIPIVAKTDDELQMPPSGAGLSNVEIDLLKKWIEEGARMPAEKESTQPVGQPVLRSNHWSLQKVKLPVVPEAIGRTSSNPIDRFVARRLDRSGLQLSRRADRATLIRRVFLVMLGVPPTPEEVTTFVTDGRADAWERLVEKVLNDPRYGERWAQHWLDVVRFGESDGYETNRERPTAWRYRDWVIRSLNDDKPYDEFVKQQIAGDALGEPVGTGFLVAGPHDIVKSPDINLTLMQRQDELADIVNTTGTTFLGLTIGCARCHDHKFDPVTQTDFFSLQAVIAGVQHGEREILPGPEAGSRLNQIDNQLFEIENRILPFLKPTSRQLTFVDDSISVKPVHAGFEELYPKAGTGINPPGEQPGYRDAAGRSGHGSNFSGGSYTWWKNRPDQDIAVYRPKIRGRFRVWISWGHGHPSHTKDARYLLDLDGNLSTKTDQREIAVVNQTRSATSDPRDSSTLPNKELWSGLKEVGEFEFNSGSALILRGGTTGSVVTADLAVFELLSKSSHEASEVPKLCLPVSPRLNIENFEPVHARAVRFEIRKTNRAEPCIDELEIHAGDINVARESGVKLSSSGNFPNNPKHRLEHINDGVTGNANSWISDSVANSWVQIELPGPAEIRQIVWGRDRTGKFSDRTAMDYQIKAQRPDGSWVTVASAASHLPADYLQSNPVEIENFLSKESRGTIAKELQTLKSLLVEKGEWSKTQRAYAGIFTPQPPPTHRLHRGDPLAKREEVTPNTIRIIGHLDLKKTSPEQSRRLALAEWIANKDNPLTARVIVNRIWQYHFGIGMVSTPSDLGENGTRPSHPELLDWLACDLMANGWSLKSIHRKILLSETWQQRSHPQREALLKDAGSRLLWRFPPRRLEAETIRDSMVSVSGAFNPLSGGPGFSAFEVQMENVRHYFPKKKYGAEDWRRMIYMTKIRQERESTFGAFDCPDGSQVMPSRSRSTTPLQALNLFNSNFVLQQSEIFAERLEAEVRDESQTVHRQIQRAYQLCYSRTATSRELAAAAKFIRAEGLPQFCRALLNSNEFLFIP